MLPPSSRLLGIVLAGGLSRRMKVDKATLPHPSSPDASLTMLQHAIRQLQDVVPEVAISSRMAQLPSNWPEVTVPVIPDQLTDQGPAMAIYSSLCYAASRGFGAILSSPIDMPDLCSQHLNGLRERWLMRLTDPAYTSAPTPISATFDGQFPQPLVTLYPVQCLPEIASVLQTSRRSLSAWLLCQPQDWVHLPETAGRNWNSPSE